MKFNIEKINPKSTDIYDLYDYIAECASVVRDKTPKSAEKLFNRLLTESYGETASRVLEYLPCKIGLNEADDLYDGVNQTFGFVDGEIYYTNARELLNLGMPLDKVLSFVDFENYAVFKIEAPYFIYGQVSTHNQLTTVSHSQRFSECDRGFWKPEEFSAIDAVTWNSFVTGSSPNSLKNTMKDFGVKRREVFERGADMLQMRVFTIGGYTNNPNAWRHFIEQRTDKHTQLETRVLAEQIKELLDE